jgi:hypothetical protein
MARVLMKRGFMLLGVSVRMPAVSLKLISPCVLETRFSARFRGQSLPIIVEPFFSW